MVTAPWIPVSTPSAMRLWMCYPRAGYAFPAEAGPHRGMSRGLGVPAPSFHQHMRREPGGPLAQGGWGP